MPFSFTTLLPPNPLHPGTAHSLPLLLLRLEGTTLFFSSIYLYHRLRRFYLAPSPSPSTVQQQNAAAARNLSWTRFVVLILVPDLGMVGFLKDPKWGSWVYNVAHWEVLPMVLVVGLVGDALGCAVGGRKEKGDDDAVVGANRGGWFGGMRSATWAKYMGIALTWLAHVGMDRMIGAGLKYETGFGHTHVGVM